MEISKFKCFRIFRDKVWIQPLRKNWKTILVKLTSESIRVVFQLFESLVCFTSGRWNRFSCCCWSWCGCRHHGSAFWEIKTYTFHWFSYDFGSIVICYCVIGFNVFGQSWKSTINNLFWVVTTKLVSWNKFLKWFRQVDLQLCLRSCEEWDHIKFSEVDLALSDQKIEMFDTQSRYLENRCDGFYNFLRVKRVWVILRWNPRIIELQNSFKMVSNSNQFHWFNIENLIWNF